MPDLQADLIAHIKASQQMKLWTERAKAHHDAGRLSEARKALAKAERWRERMEEIERRYAR